MSNLIHLDLEPAFRPIDAIVDHLALAGWTLLAQNVHTRYGELDFILRRNDTIVFGCHRDNVTGPDTATTLLTGRHRRQARRCAVSWMAANPALQKGVNRYRFDLTIAAPCGTRASILRDAF